MRALQLSAVTTSRLLIDDRSLLLLTLLMLLLLQLLLYLSALLSVWYSNLLSKISFQDSFVSAFCF
jgi:hypothetical protein